MTLNVPTVTNGILTLRGYAETDFEAFCAFAASDRSRFVGGPQNRDDSWRSFLASIGHWALRGYGMWIVEDRDSGQVAGRVGVVYNDGWHEPELAWHIYDGFEGRSVAYSAAVLARDYCARQFGMTRLMSYIHADNSRSLRLAKRLGCTYERDVTVRDIPSQIWRHPSVSEGVA